nr:MAG TPA: hypothetical protein [Caudoviricetes sp.]
MTIKNLIILCKIVNATTTILVVMSIYNICKL